jgi:hypothetical protein
LLLLLLLRRGTHRVLVALVPVGGHRAKQQQQARNTVIKNTLSLSETRFFPINQISTLSVSLSLSLVFTHTRARKLVVREEFLTGGSKRFLLSLSLSLSLSFTALRERFLRLFF